MDHYEKHPDGSPLSTGNFDYRAYGYDGFMGFGQDIDGNCCGTENELDCICDDQCEITDCVKWHGKIPGSATIVVPSVGLEPGGTFTVPLNQVTFDEFSGYERCPTWMPYKVTKIPYEDRQIWWQDASEYRDIPWFLRDCYPLPSEKAYLPPPCEEHVKVNEDGTIDVSQPGVETPIPLQFYGYTERPGCNDSTEFFSMRITLRFISSTLNSCGTNCREDYFPQEVCGDYARDCICTPDASRLALEITGGAQFTGFNWSCGEPARPEFNQDAEPPQYICLNNAFGFGHNTNYNPQQAKYEFTRYSIEPSPCWSGVYSSNPCDYWQRVTINMVDNPNQ